MTRQIIHCHCAKGDRLILEWNTGYTVCTQAMYCTDCHKCTEIRQLSVGSLKFAVLADLHTERTLQYSKVPFLLVPTLSHVKITDIRKRPQEPTSQVVCMKINPSSNRQLARPASNRYTPLNIKTAIV
jgi:hypothetical protein